MKVFEENDRYNYPDLTPASVVMDVGAFEGNFAYLINEKYGCFVNAYEPVPAFYNQLVRRFAVRPKIRLWPFGLGRGDGSQRFGVKGDMSGRFCTSPNSFEDLPVHDFIRVADNLLPSPSLVKINAEGAEYEIMEYVIETGFVATIPHWQIQFHTVVPDFKRRHDEIVRRLTETHEHVYGAPFIWDGFSIRK